MHVKEISLDGFKSYAQRVIILGFDPQFNAITGLNGSGKSNILDSICFVLGIQNLQQVRANSLQELVYKQGQAGITKATVSIVFDNHDKERSPVGYEHLDEITVTRQLVIGGRSKYLINGKVAEPTRVQNLFHSVQLNVNNPHFLIMQGRITKVLNMKPAEILGLLEEAAGTKMYETKKQAALRTLEKKQVKVDEINKVLTMDIMPALDKLRNEKVQYMEWQNASSNLDRLRRFCVAYRYVEAERLQQGSEDQGREVQQAISNLDAQEASLDLDIRNRDTEVQQLQAQKEQQSEGEVKHLVQLVDDLSKQVVKGTSSWENKKELQEAELVGIAQAEASLEELGEAGLQARLEAATAARNEAQQACERAQAGLVAAQNELAGAEAGDGRDGSNRSMQERLVDAQNAQTEAVAEAKAAEARIKHLRKQIAEQKKEFAAKEKEGFGLRVEVEKARDALDKLRQKLTSSGYDAAAAEQLEQTTERERSEVRRWKDKMDEQFSHLSALNFQYQDPERGFDRSRVKGVVARLVRITDPSTSTALEVAAGGKLYQVVVDSEQTAKALLARGQLRNRVTIIPLNKVTSRDLPGVVRSAARKLASDKACPALDLVGYDQELAAAIKYAFGGAFVCKDSSTAKSLAFSPEVNTRCITLEGDDFNPGGTLTGGSRNRSSSVLARVHELAAAEAELETHQAALQQAESTLRAMAAAAKEHHKLSQQVELQQHGLGLLEERLQGSEAQQIAQALSSSEGHLGEAEQALQAARDKQQQMMAAARQLEKDIASFGKERDKLIKAATGRVAAAKAGVEAARKELKAKEAQLQACIAEAEAAAGERAALSEQLQAARQTARELEGKVAELAAAMDAAKEQYEQQSEQLQVLQAWLRECDAEISAALRERTQLEQRKTDLVIERKKLNNKLEFVRNGMAEAGEKCRKLEREYPWIASEKAHFGQPGSDYDWQATDSQKAFADYEATSVTIEGLSRKVNRKVMQMFEKAQLEYSELRRKKEVVENDKRKLEEVMGDLDEKKRQALETTWLKVNGDFGSIFSTLLPGTTAKLEPQEGRSFLEGLEVRVAFGGVWKETLSELSGGQKSLLALSLILAMLRFKPAPIYILDEVDSALDLSHTQNIGRMIKAHFPQSQFIVVSLKEGMFNNANVIFRTKFIDGVSTVTRSVNERRGQDGKRAAAGAGEAPRAALRENVARH